MIKRRILLHIIFFVVFGVTITTSVFAGGTQSRSSSNTVSLDRAILMAAREIEDSITDRQRIALLNFSSPSEQFSEYVLEEISEQLVRGRKLTVVDRRELDVIRQERNFQYSGEVSDESAVDIGRLLGAQLVFSGSLRHIGNVYRLRFRVLDVESATVISAYSADVSDRESTVMFLLGIESNESVQINETQRQTLLTRRRAATYNIGDTGPAGGIIFYDKGEFSDGWRYLEAAPASTEFRVLWGWGNIQDNSNRDQWGGSRSGVYIPYVDTRLGSGKQNTLLIANYLREIHSGYFFKSAAHFTSTLNIGGYNDWFLPSKDELDLMYRNLRQNGLGNFSRGVYWSSSLSSPETVTVREKWRNITAQIQFPWIQLFNNGEQQTSDELFASNLVRAIRSF